MMFAAAVHRLANLLTEAGPREIRCLGREKSPVEPGRPGRADLLFEPGCGEDADNRTSWRRKAELRISSQLHY